MHHPYHTRNKFFNEKLARFIMKSYIHILPLWTGLMSTPDNRARIAVAQGADNSVFKTTFSSAVAECWFKIVKENILLGEDNLKLNRFI